MVAPVTAVTVIVPVKKMLAVSWTVAPSVRATTRSAWFETGTTHAWAIATVPAEQVAAHVAAAPAE